MRSRRLILVIASDPERAEYVRVLLTGLTNRDVEVRTETSDRQALDAALTLGTALDLAIVDAPVVNEARLNLLSELRRHCPLSVRLVMGPGSDVDFVLLALEHGATAYVRQTSGDSELLDAVERALDRAAESRRLERDVVDAIPAYLLALDERDRIVLWNERLERATGFERGEMLGQPGGELVGPGDRKLPSKSGARRVVRWHQAEVPRADGGRVRYVLGVDVTDEQSMLRRTLRAERLAAAGTLATGLAHELRNPLNSAALQLQVLRRRLGRNASSEEMGPVLSLVEDELGRLERLTSDFLAFAQPRPTAFKRTDLNALVIRTAEQFRTELARRGITLETSLDPGAGFIEAAPEQLGQALSNLIHNALEAMADRGVLRLVTNAADDQSRVSVSVEDDGPGLPEDAPIFDAFFTTKRGGTGLGLAIVHRIASDHGGSVEFESRPGATRFSLLLPQFISSAARA